MSAAADVDRRCLALWFPSWPVLAWVLAEGRSIESPVAVVAGNRIIACSAVAVADGVRAGQRRREAQSRCPELEIVSADEARDAREYAPVIDCVERLAPGVQVIRPGLCVLRARGLASYLGGEELAAETLLEAVVSELGIVTGRVGIADGVFAAIQAARQAGPVWVVDRGGSASFLAELPISRLGDPAVTQLLPRLGVRTLGEFAALEVERVRERFGAAGVRLHALAAGVDSSTVTPRRPPPELAAHLDFEPPLALVDQVAFASRATVAGFVDGLTAAGLVCTEVRLEFSGELDEFSARTWLTPGVFDAAAITDRIRWQLQAAAGTQILSGVTSLRLEPVAVDELANHAPGIFGLGPDERVHHAMSRVQAMLGHAGVLTTRIGGGRWLAERQVLVPWGDWPATSVAADPPWPGKVPEPLPSVVFPALVPVILTAVDGGAVDVDERGRLRAAPARLLVEGRQRSVSSWAGPWPVSERGWDPQRARRADRFQVVADDGSAWLLLFDERGCWAEARYD